MTTATITKTSPCPDWCNVGRVEVDGVMEGSGHLDFGDETEVEDHDGPHFASVPSLDSEVHPVIGQTTYTASISSGCLSTGEMYVHLDASGEQFSPDQARAIASALIEAATWAEANHA